MSHAEYFTCWWGTFSLTTRGPADPVAHRPELAKLASGIEEVARDPTQRLRLGLLVGGSGIGETTPRRLVDEVTQAIASGRLVVSIEERPALQGAARPMALTNLRDVVSQAAPRRTPATVRERQNVTPAAEPECDFDSVRLGFKPEKVDENDLRKFSAITLQWRDGAIRSDLPPSPLDLVSVPSLELTASADPKRGGRAIAVAVEGGPGHACTRHHPRVVVHPVAGDRLEHDGQPNVDFVAVSRDASTLSTAAGALAVLRSCHFAAESVNRYYVVVDACGERRDGKPVRGHVAQEILVYPADEWKLELTIPLIETRKDVWKRPPGKEWRGVEGDEAGDNQPSASLDGDVGPSWSLKIEPPKVTPTNRDRPGFKLSRTKSPVAWEVELELGWLAAFADLERALRELGKSLGGAEVQLGYRFSIVTKVLEGALSYAWGFREAADRRVYRWWKLEAKITWLDLEFELSFGFVFSIWGFKIEGVVYGTIAGKWAWSIGAESTPENVTGFVNDHWEIPGRAGVRATLGPDWLAARGEVITGITLDNKISWGEEPLDVKCRANFVGMKATLRGEIKLCGVFASRAHSWVWMEPRVLIPAPEAAAASEAPSR